MIDFHTHILPRIDDGSRDLGMTEAMLREEGRQGVRLVIATPHFYADEMSIDGFLERRAMAMAETEGVRHKAEETLPAVLAGAEVRYFDGIGAAKEIAALCVEGTETMLLELRYMDGRGWEDTISMLAVSESCAYRMHRRALAGLDNLPVIRRAGGDPDEKDMDSFLFSGIMNSDEKQN